MDKTIVTIWITIWIVGLLVIANVYMAVGIVLLALKNYRLCVLSIFSALLYFLLTMLLIKFQSKARG